MALILFDSLYLNLLMPLIVISSSLKAANENKIGPKSGELDISKTRPFGVGFTFFKVRPSSCDISQPYCFKKSKIAISPCKDFVGRPFNLTLWPKALATKKKAACE